MTTDPILNLFSIILRRLILFILLSLSFAVALWCWLLLVQFNLSASDLLIWFHAAWPPADNKVASVFLWSTLAMGVLTSSLIYFMVGLWWNKRGDIHHRGARWSQDRGQ